MRIGEFEFPEPLPELRSPHVIACLTPWVDAGSVGTLSLARLERHLNANALGSLSAPGTYFDFTRYRPIVHYEQNERRLNIPNTNLRYATGQDCDFIFLHMLEPHASAEGYIDSIVQVLLHFQVQRICRVGGMYDAVPHTRPLLVMGTLNNEPLKGVHGVDTSHRSPYQGPTSIMNLVGEKARAAGIDNLTLMVRLPHYIQLEEDHRGTARLLNVLSSLYDFPEELAASRRSSRPYERFSAEMERSPEIMALVNRLEADYDARLESRPEETDESSQKPPAPLSPSVEQFLGELSDKLKDS